MSDYLKKHKKHLLCILSGIVALPLFLLLYFSNIQKANSMRYLDLDDFFANDSIELSYLPWETELEEVKQLLGAENPEYARTELSQNELSFVIYVPQQQIYMKALECETHHVEYFFQPEIQIITDQDGYKNKIFASDDQLTPLTITFYFAYEDEVERDLAYDKLLLDFYDEAQNFESVIADRYMETPVEDDITGEIVSKLTGLRFRTIKGEEQISLDLFYVNSQDDILSEKPYLIGITLRDAEFPNGSPFKLGDYTYPGK